MPPKSVSASAEVARLISKREMYFSIIQKTYDMSRDVEDASSKQQFCIKTSPLRVIIDTASDRTYVTESFCKSAQLEITPIEAHGHVNDSAANEGYYIPHFAVIKDSSSTPLRIVFDASAKNAEFPSLNANLFSGPKLQSNIITILLNFRFGEIALTANIKQMYRNILICNQDRRFQRILWKFSPKDPLGIYELNTVTFGITSSPFHALRTIKQLAKDESKNYPLATDIIQNDIYIDDVVTSANTIEIAKQLYVQLSSLFRSARFELAKRASNDRLMYKQFESHHKTQINFSQTISEFDTSVKVLGLRWDPIQDCCKFNINLLHQNWTKRHILSTIARIWDPLGFITPVTIKFKMIMKELWLLKLDWDDSSLVATWLSIYNQLPELINLSISRFVGTKNYIRCSLYGFADSSEKAYGAVIYIKPCHDNKYYLLISKSKITPIKVQTLARLELCAAHLLAKLLSFVISSNHHSLCIEEIYGFTDSMIVLHWLTGPAHRWKTFVANRVTKVHDLLPSAKWYHIPSETNIADCVSRGSLPNTLLNNSNCIVRQRIHKCNKCFKSHPKSFTPIMADLPSPRVMEAKPFQHTGTDYAGPSCVTMGKFRGVKSSKA
ncbi:uncharacterized protein LOC113371416 [Ctenocephalides felis]|uniref:uncharacterized protein LOC113371416 n=1 Tax=Ctenocephalides felis TaxID=7515 RepID=UPI000E6E1CCB|nr:uncharacterized protein LOC113371416 [Ctenocephalides felis]